MKRLFNMFLVVMFLTISLSSVYADEKEQSISLPEIGTLSILDANIQSVDFSSDDKYIVNEGNRLLAGNTLVDTSSLPNVVTTGIKIEVESTDMSPDDTQKIIIKELLSDGSSKDLPISLVNPNSADKEVAEILYGNLISKKLGMASIKVSYEGFTDELVINVHKYKTIKKKVDIDVSKEWTIKFNMYVDSKAIKGEISI